MAEQDTQLQEASSLVTMVPAHGGGKLHRRLGWAINALTRLSPKLGGWLAIQLFTRPRRLKFQPEAQQALKAAEALRLANNPPLVGYRWMAEPTAPRVLLIHGWESHSARWLPMQARLQTLGINVTAFDGPAAGASGGRRTPFNRYVAAALAFDAAYGPFDAYVGHSLGGGVAIQLAARVPDHHKPQAVVAMASFDESEKVFDRYHHMLGLDARVRAAFDREIEAELRGGSVRDYSNTLAAAQLAGVRGLIVHSDDDNVSPIEGGLALHAAWPGAELLRLHHEGHRLLGEATQEAIVQWLAQQLQGTPQQDH